MQSRKSKTGTRAFRLALLFLLTTGVAFSELGPEQERALLDARDGNFVVWPGLVPTQRAELRSLADVYLARYQSSHAPHGYTANLRWADRERTLLRQYDGLGDGAIWTGHYLAALAFQYRVEPSEVLLDAMLQTLESLDLLTEVSGKSGFVARYVGQADDPLYQPYYVQYGGDAFLRPGFGARAFPGAVPYADLVWLGASSRDTYDGIHFGCAAVWRYVDDAAVRARVRLLVERIGKRLIADRFLLLDERGHVELPNPSFWNAWLRLMLTVSPDTFRDYRIHYEFSAWLFFAIDRILGPGFRPIDEARYYPNNLNMARLFTLCTMEEDSARRAAYQAVLRRSYQDQLSTHLNAHFAAIYLLCTGDGDRAAIATLEGGLADFPQDKFLHVPEPVDLPPGEAYAPGALLVRQRSMRDFIWQRPPAKLPDVELRSTEYPGIDFLLPYWMARVSGLLD
jgi:hypothetical protein